MTHPQKYALDNKANPNTTVMPDDRCGLAPVAATIMPQYMEICNRLTIKMVIFKA